MVLPQWFGLRNGRGVNHPAKRRYLRSENHKDDRELEEVWQVGSGEGGHGKIQLRVTARGV